MNFSEVIDEQVGAHVDLNCAIDETALDSLEYLELVQRLEREFQVTLPDEDFGRIRTFRDLELLIEQKRGC